MMHHRDQRMALAQRFRLIGHHAECEPVDHDGTAFRHVVQLRLRGCARQLARMRKAFAKIDNLRTPAEFAQFRDHALVIGVAAGRSIEIARYCENEIAFHQSGASYQARAFGDSPTVTRNAETSGGVRPSLFAVTAAANCSNTQCVSHSVVVLTPLNSGMSSRFL